MLKTKQNAKGFTLIELLVVIAIIGILAAVVLIALNPIEFLKRSRDTQRLSDMNTLVSATKLFQTNNPAVVLPLGPSCHSGIVTTANGQKSAGGTGWVMINFNLGVPGATLPAIPVDPATSNTQRYAYAADVNQNFEYSAVLESTINTVKMTGDGGDDAARYEAGTVLNLNTTTATACPSGV